MPACEPTHALAAALREAEAAKQAGTERTILTVMCGDGHLDLPAYEAYLSGALTEVNLSDEAIADAMAGIPAVG